MLQTILDGARESGHELELVFFEPGPWPRRARRCRLSRGGDRHRPRAPAPPPAASVLRLARLLRRRRPDLIVNWIAKTQLYCAPGGRARGHGRPGRVVAARRSPPDTGWTAARPMLPALRRRLLLERRRRARRRGCRPARPRSSWRPARPCPRAPPAARRRSARATGDVPIVGPRGTPAAVEGPGSAAARPGAAARARARACTW